MAYNENPRDLLHASHSDNGSYFTARVIVRDALQGTVPQAWGSGKTPVEAYNRAFHQIIPNGHDARATLGIKEDLKTVVQLPVHGTVYEAPIEHDVNGPVRGQVKSGLGRAVFKVYEAAQFPKTE